MALAKTAPPTLSTLIVSALTVASLTGAIRLSQPHIVLLGGALDTMIAGVLYAAPLAFNWVKNWWDTRRVASPETTVPIAEATLQAAAAGVKVDPKAIEAAHRVLDSKMAELAAK